MKKRFKTNSSLFEFFILIFLLWLSILYLNGCTLTPKALKLANEKATPQYEYWNIKRIVSATKLENGDVSLCVELNKSEEIEDHKLNTIRIPLSILNGEANQHERHGFYPGECPIACYWYPIQKVESGCNNITIENVSNKSFLQIEKLAIHTQDEFYDFLNSSNKTQIQPDRIFEVHHPSNNISTIYWFVQIDQQNKVLNSISGIYEDKSSNFYYLAVLTAMVGDVVIGVVVVAVYIAGVALGVYLQL